MKRIAFVITDLSNGGAERVVSILANYFDSKKYTVKILALNSNEISYPLNTNIQFKYLDVNKNNLLKPFKRISALRKELNDADLVISFLWFINVYTLAANFFKKKKVIISDRSDPANELNGNRIFEIIRNFFYRLPNKIVFQTPDAKKYYSKFIQQKGVIIPNPISPNLPKWNSKNDSKTIISICRLAEQKNLKMTIDAFAKFTEKFPNYKLVIYGEGPLRSELENYISKLGLSDKISLPGYVNNITDKLVNSSIYVSSSNYEGISNSMLEALGVGVPTIVTDCPVGGARMFVRNNNNGILVNVGDMEQLYEGLIKLASDEKFANYLSVNARDINIELDQSEICEQWNKLLL
jgi:GalNAc-alpha-(1->4)-GalNAc-alpha-(1->3)-diNAcBac-PP-undecaprenol alpha-1,4-N-acetyl-D-galactosaminyltransferase